MPLAATAIQCACGCASFSCLDCTSRHPLNGSFFGVGSWIMATTYVELGDNENDELPEIMPPSPNNNSPHGFANPSSSASSLNIYGGALQHSQLLAAWKVWCSTKALMCATLLYFLSAPYPTKSRSAIGKTRTIRSTKETNIFGDFSVTAYVSPNIDDA